MINAHTNACMHTHTQHTYSRAVLTFFFLSFQGVAPDHAEVKAVTNDFATTLSDTRCRFFGNVTVCGFGDTVGSAVLPG
jgi:hypothetical protein